MSVDPLIDVKNLSFSYDGMLVLDDVSFTVKKGDYVGVIGPNGGGKTTLLKILLGLLQPQSGSVHLFGRSIVSGSVLKSSNQQMGYVPQRVSSTQSFFPATVEEVVRTGRTSIRGPFGRFSSEDQNSVEEAMEVVKISDLRHRLMHELSGGERQRVFMARALARRPKLLILDEPTVGVDLKAQEEFYHFLKKLNQEEGMAILLVSHDIDVVSKQVGCVLCLNCRMICHTDTKDFIEKDFLKELYGDHSKFIVHH